MTAGRRWGCEKDVPDSTRTCPHYGALSPPDQVTAALPVAGSDGARINRATRQSWRGRASRGGRSSPRVLNYGWWNGL